MVEQELQVTTPATELSPREAMEKIQRGEPLEDVRIVGLRLRGEFARPIEMKHVTLVRPQFDHATFQAAVTLAHCALDKPRFVRKTVFEQGLNLAGSTLRRPHFHEITMKGPLRMDNAHVVGPMHVTHSHFANTVRLWDCRFDGWVEFRHCQFDAEADFRSFHANEGFVVEHCVFRNALLLRGASVAKKLDLGSSRFEGLLDLSKSKLHDFVYLEGIGQGEAQRFAFSNALAERILIQNEQLFGRILSEQAGDYETAMHEYGLLKRVFQTLHRYEDEDWAFYRFKINQRRAHHRSWLRPWSKLAEALNWLFLDLGCGYGTNPVRAVSAAVLIVLGFALIYFLGIRDFHIEHAPVASLGIDNPINRALCSLMTSVSIFTSGLGGDLLNRAEGWMFLPLLVEAILGTLLWGLFIVAFSRKVIR